MSKSPKNNSPNHRKFADGILRNPERVKRLMRSYARNQGSQAANVSICADIAANESKTFDSDTVYSYINALKKYL